MKKTPMFEQMANEITEAVTAVLKKWEPEIKKRKVSRHLVGYWIHSGANRAKYPIKSKDPS